jgi:hypothetical protein
MSDDICECGVPGWALNISSTDYPDNVRCGDLPLQGKIPAAEEGIEPGTSCLAVRNSDHQATRLVVHFINTLFNVGIFLLCVIYQLVCTVFMYTTRMLG